MPSGIGVLKKSLLAGLAVAAASALGACAGLRHLFWDAGLGLSVTASFRSGVMAMAFSVVATVVVWAAGLGSGGQ